MTLKNFKSKKFIGYLFHRYHPHGNFKRRIELPTKVFNLPHDDDDDLMFMVYSKMSRI